MPITWRLSAESLLRAARALEPIVEADRKALADPTRDPPEESIRAGVGSIHMMLIGMAIENLAKALFVAANPALRDPDRLARELQTHTLVEFLEQGQLEMDEQDWFLCERLETFVVWAGRYPVPTKLENYLPRQHPAGGSSPLTFTSSEDRARIDRLVEQLTRLAIQEVELEDSDDLPTA